MNILNFVLILLLAWGCNPQDSSIEIKTSGIFKPITFGIDDQDLSGQDLDLGEWVTSDGAKSMTVTVRNNTLFPYTEIDLAFSPLNNEFTAMRFKPLESGESIFPGNGGTCDRVLSAGTSCTIMVELLPPIDGEYKEQLHLSFKNYVDFENHIGSIFILSGVPAELAIQEISSRIRFGDIVGPDALVERTIPRTFTQSFTIKNVGGLSAKNLIIRDINTCKDVNDNSCDDFKDAYTIQSHNCKDGDRIKKDETCDFTLTYTPKNNSEVIAERYERVRYEGGLTVEYIKNPYGARATLGVNYDSLSSKIEGRLLSPATLDLTSNGLGIVQGNRLSKDIRTINVGYRSLRINKLKVTKPSLSSSNDESWALCERQANTTLLHCYDELDTSKAPIPLKIFPFSISDLDGCVGDKTTGPLIPIGDGCNFRITFQPSSETHFIEPANPASFLQTNFDKVGKNIKFFVIYDSQWKDGENHCDNKINCDPLEESGYRKTNFNFGVKAKRRSAARLEFLSIKYNNVPLIDVPNTTGEINSSLSTDLNYLKTYDFGRLALLANSQKGKISAFKKIQIVVKNIGQETATLDKITFPLNDSTEIIIPHDSQVLSSLNDTNDCVNSLNHCYYRNARVVSDCSEITSEQICTLEILFAPFVFTNLSFEKNRAMYNYPFPVGLTTEKFKSFKISYKNGASFTDDSNLTTPNFPNLKTEIRFRATLTEKGQLEEIADDPENFKSLNQGITRGSLVTYKMRLTNVGSGRVSKINMILGGTGYGFNASPDCSSIIKDCRCYQNSTENCQLNETVDSLPSDGECFLPLSWKMGGTSPIAEISDDLRKSSGGVTPQEKTNDINRVNYNSYGTSSSFSLTSNLSYYDCFRHTLEEINAGKAGSTYNSTFGYPITQPQFSTIVSPLSQPVRLVPIIPGSSVPWHTAFLGRTQMTTPSLGPIFPERIFYNNLNSSSINLDVANPFIESFTQDNSLILAARDSFQYAKNLKNTNLAFLNTSETNTLTYYYFMGSFPRYAIGTSATSFKVPFDLQNINPGAGSIKSIQISNVMNTGTVNLRQIINNVEQSTILSTNSNYGFQVDSLGSVKYNAEINPSLCSIGKCLYAVNILFTYDTGKRDQNRLNGNWIKTCTSTDEECERKIRLVVYGEIDSSIVSPIRIDSAPVTVNLVGNSMYESCTGIPFTQYSSGTWNQTNGGTALPHTSIRYQKVDATSAYYKRVIKITNISSGNLSVRRAFLRQDNNNPAKYVTFSNDIRQNVNYVNADSACLAINSNFCTDNKVLTPNQFCYTTTRYQPTIQNFINLNMSFLVTTQASQNPHVIYNVPLSFQPILEAVIQPVSNANVALSKINVLTKLKADGAIGVIKNTLQVHKITIPPQVLTQSSPVQVYTHYQKILNSRTTKASLLYEWRLFNNNLNSEPDSTAFEFDTNDSRNYVQIGQNSLGFMKIFASRQCFYGMDSSPNSESGFSNSEHNCYLKIIIDIKHNNMLNTSVASKDETIDPYIFRINYYRVGRSSIGNFIFYVEFNSKPAALAATDSSWGQITSAGLNSTLRFPPHDSSLPNIGTIVGYRVIRTKLVSSLADFFNLANPDISRIDVYNTTNPEAIFTAPSSEFGRIYHYKVLLIRQHPNFTKGVEWFGFGSSKKDHFITDITNFSSVKVFVPPAGNLYFHSQKLLVDSARFTDMEEYTTALSRCTVKSITVKNGNVNSSVAKSLINSTAWNAIASIEQTGDPLWIFSTTPYDFSIVCPMMDGTEDPSKRCFRTSIDVTTGREMRGNLVDYGLLSPAYVEEILYYGYSRCMTNLSNFL